MESKCNFLVPHAWGENPKAGLLQLLASKKMVTYTTTELN